MTAPERDWREAKIAQWAKDGIEAELNQYRLTVALSWPTEAKPQPMPFRWGEYDRSFGTPVPGRYWSVPHHSRIEEFELARCADLPAELQPRGVYGDGWVFRRPGGKWTTSVQRGPLFQSERDAILYALWLACEEAAKTLLNIRSKL